MLAVNQQEKELGTLKFGQAHNFSYLLTNKDTQPIEIMDVVVGCSSCTKASFTRKIMEPGQSTDINVVFTPGSKGIQLKSVQIVYKLGATPQPPLNLKFKAMVNE